MSTSDDSGSTRCVFQQNHTLLPPAAQVNDALHAAFASAQPYVAGAPSRAYAALAAMPADALAACVTGVDGQAYALGETALEFTLMSVSKPFVLALVADALGPEAVRARVGMNATGLPYHQLTAIERGPNGRTNPLVNPGAMTVASLVPGQTAAEQWAFLAAGVSRFAGRSLALAEDVAAEAIARNRRNRATADLLQSRGQLGSAAATAVELYSRQCSLLVNTLDLGIMAATLAHGGVQPVTGQRVVSPEACRMAVVAMTVAGLYEHTGDWLYDVGLPAKSGIGGGLIGIAPGRAGVAAFSPRIDGVGTSVRGKHLIRHLARALGLGLFASEAAVTAIGDAPRT